MAAGVDVLVVGGGAAGIAAARSAREAGAAVALVAEATGASALTGGVVWGASAEPFAAWSDPAVLRRGGRYVTVAGWIVAGAQGALASLLDLGALSEGVVGVVDLPAHPSWSARLVAETLGARVLALDDPPSGETFREVAAVFDTEGIAEGVAARLVARYENCRGLAAVLFPPVLGLRRLDVAQQLSAVLGVPAGEAAGGPGDPPGVRLERAVRQWLPADVRVLRARARVEPGPRPVVTFDRGEAVSARAVVLATGGLAGGGLVFGEALREATAGATVWTRAWQRVPARSGARSGADPAAWFAETSAGAPESAGAGVRTDARGRVLDADGETPLARWLFAAGDVAVARGVAPGMDFGGPGLADALAAGALAGREAARFAREG